MYCTCIPVIYSSIIVQYSVIACFQLEIFGLSVYLLLQNLEDATHETAIDVLKGVTGKVKLVVKYSPKILEEMEFRFEHTKSFRRGGRHSTRH